MAHGINSIAIPEFTYEERTELLKKLKPLLDSAAADILFEIKTLDEEDEEDNLNGEQRDFLDHVQGSSLGKTLSPPKEEQKPSMLSEDISIFDLGQNKESVLKVYYDANTFDLTKGEKCPLFGEIIKKSKLLGSGTSGSSSSA